MPVYQLKVVLKGISPMIWRRLQVSGACTMEDLHHILQIAMGWSDDCLNRFKIHGRDYGVYHPGGIWFSDDVSEVQLADLQLREREKFLYEYDFTDDWKHQIRVETISYPEQQPEYPLCLGGKRAAPPEGCGGPWAFQANPQPNEDIGRAIEPLAEIVAGGAEAMRERYDEICQIHDQLHQKDFDAAKVNRHLQRYSSGARYWMYDEEFADAVQNSVGH